MLMWPKQSLKIIQMRLTSHGRQPQNINSGISQQSLLRSDSNFKLMLMWPKQSLQILKMKTTSHRRRPLNIKSRISQ